MWVYDKHLVVFFNSLDVIVPTQIYENLFKLITSHRNFPLKCVFLGTSQSRTTESFCYHPRRTWWKPSQGMHSRNGSSRPSRLCNWRFEWWRSKRFILASSKDQYGVVTRTEAAILYGCWVCYDKFWCLLINYGSTVVFISDCQQN